MKTLSGFTLIELSVVLVIIGLIVGGVLVGRDLVAAAQVRAQISQIEKYNQAVNTFRSKYNYLPGDIVDASNFGFTPRVGTAGRGDGNGYIEGCCITCMGCPHTNYQTGEAAYFWEDLSQINAIEGRFNWVLDAYNPSVNPVTSTTSPPLSAWVPRASIGQENYVYIEMLSNKNYFGLGAVVSFLGWGPMTVNPGLTVKQAFNIDKKTDDGFPQTGRVIAQFPSWAMGGGGTGASPGSAASGSATTCYDNAGDTNAAMVYSLTQNNGSGVNCGLSFQFQ